MIKYHAGTSGTDLEGLRSDLERYGFEARRLEREGRFRLLSDVSSPGDRAEELERLTVEEPVDGRSIWAAFNWEERIDLEASLEQQRALTKFVEGGSMVVKTSVLEEKLEEWPEGVDRRAQLQHSGTIWLAEEGVSLSRIGPLPES